MKYLVKISFALLIAVTAVNAQSKACKEKEADAKQLFEKCKAFGKGHPEYEACKNQYNTLKQQVSTACGEGMTMDDLKNVVIQSQDLVNTCKGRQDERCSNALATLGTYQYKLEDMSSLDNMTKYDELVVYCQDQDMKPAKCKNIGEPPKPDHNKSLGFFMEYIKTYPKNPKVATVLYQAAAVLESMGEEEKAYKLRLKLVEEWPQNGYVPKAWLRIAEYFFNNRKFKDAIESYSKVTDFNSLVGKEAALAMYHLAESYYNIADYEKSSAKYFEYIVGSDNKKYPSDLRQEAMDFMAAAFSDMESGGVNEASEFLKDKKVAFKDSLYFRIGMKNKDHDRNEQAVTAFNFLLQINPNYIDAPLADLALVEIMLTLQRPDQAQEQRYKVVQRYTKGSSWFKQNQQYPQSVQIAEQAIRQAMLEIPNFEYIKASNLYKSGDVEAGKKMYAQAAKSYNDFLTRYATEPSWEEYKVHGFLSSLYQDLKNLPMAIKELNWIDDCDTTKYGRRPQGTEQLIKKEEAAYNAVILADQARDEGIKTAAGGDEKKAYTMPATKAYFAQVDRYMKKWGKTKDAPVIAYNAAVVHYNAQQYNVAISTLKQLRTDFPKHEYILIIARMLAQSQLESGSLDEAQKEFEWLLVQYKGKENKNDSMATQIDKSIAAVLYQKADKEVKANNFEAAAKAFLALVDRYPSLEFSDKAVFEAAASYESAGKLTLAAETFLLMPKKYASSPLTIKSILRAAVNYKKDLKPRDAARTFLVITDNFPQDSSAFSAIGWAAGVYDSAAIRSKTAQDSATYKKLAGQTYEIAFKKYPKHEKTPGMLYSACVSYEEAKIPDEAIRCERDVVREYPKSSYALDAAYSIPMAYKAVKKWDLVATEFLNFAKMYQSDKEKLIAAYYEAAKAYVELKQVDKAVEQFKNVQSSYDKYGLQLKNADPSVPAEATFYLAEQDFAKMAPLAMKGKDKDKEKALKDLMKVLGDAMTKYAKAAEYASEKWTFRATNKMGELFVTIAAKIREQEIIAASEEEKFAERITVVQQLPSYYEQARPIFQKNIDLAREQGFYNPDVVAAEEGYIEMFYQDCATFFEVGDAFANAPTPNRDEIIAEYMDPNGDAMAKEDAEMAADEDLEAYKEELKSKAEQARVMGLPKCATGIKASAHYGIDNKWTQKLFAMVKATDSTHEALATVIKKFDPTTLFQDKPYFKTKARLDQIKTSEVMTMDEKLATYKQVASEAKALTAKLKAELEQLQERVKALTAPPAPANTPTGATETPASTTAPATVK